MNCFQNLILPVIFYLLFLVFSPTIQANDLPITLTDALGNTITLNTYPERIVSLAPSNTELLYAVGAGDQLVGTTKYCDYPPEAVQIAKVGGFSNPNLEQIILLQPDLVLAARFNPLDLLESLRRLDVLVFALAPDNLEEVLQTLRQIGRLSGHDEAALQTETTLRSRVNAVRKAVENIPESARPLVLWGQLKAPMYTAGKGSFIDDIIRIAGGINIAADLGRGWPQIGLEILVTKNPQAIITSDGRDKIKKDLTQLRTKSGWKTVDAIANGQVYSLDRNLLSRPGPRLIAGLEAVAQILHPNLFLR